MSIVPVWFRSKNTRDSIDTREKLRELQDAIKRETKNIEAALRRKSETKNDRA